MHADAATLRLDRQVLGGAGGGEGDLVPGPDGSHCLDRAGASGVRVFRLTGSRRRVQPGQALICSVWGA
jgi:hypothetical protein